MKTKLFLASGTLVALLVLVASGCEVTSEKIQTWKQTVKGAAKIRAAVRDTGQTLPIRVEAAEALCEMGLFAPLNEDMKALVGDDREKILQELTKRLLAKMEGSNPGSTTRVQIQAKDALFAIRDLASDPMRRTIDEKLGRWILADWVKRGAGEHSADKIITTLGDTAGPLLAESIGQGTPVVVAATLLRKVGGQSDRDRGAEQLVELAKKEDPPNEQTYLALGKVGSLKANQYLLDVAQKGDYKRRLWSLRALTHFPHPSSIQIARTIAANAQLKDDQALLRDEAFTLLEKVADPQSLDVLIGFLADKDKMVRYRAAEAVLSGFGAKGLTKLLDGFPSGYTYKKEDLEDFIEKDVQELGKSALPALREALGSKNWVARLVAARLLGRIGTKQDVTALEKLGSDSTRIRGWDGGATVGSEALEAAKQLKTR